jgi:GNAT superfamily N-acetyltransferase
VDFLALAQRLESIQAHAMRALASDIAPLADGWMTANGQGSYLNKAVGFGFGKDVGSEALEALQSFFSTRGIEPKAELTAFAPIPLLRALAERGFFRAVNRPEHDGFIAYLDGVAVGAGGCATREGVTSLFGTSVRPAFRGRGIQQALMAARLERAVALGSQLADITSRPGIPTERNAARLGFQMAYARIVLVKRGPGLIPSP